MHTSRFSSYEVQKNYSRGGYNVIDLSNGVSVAWRQTESAAKAAMEEIENGTIPLWNMPLV